MLTLVTGTRLVLIRHLIRHGMPFVQPDVPAHEWHLGTGEAVVIGEPGVKCQRSL
jgi:hypothetical protein